EASARPQTATSCNTSQDHAYRQTSGRRYRTRPQARIGDPLYSERGGSPGSDRMAGSRARAWLNGAATRDMQSVWNIVSIVCWNIKLSRLTISSYQKNTGRSGLQNNDRRF